LAGIERLGDGRTVVGARRFEAVWSVDPVVVRDAADIGAALAGDHYDNDHDGHDDHDQRRPAGTAPALMDPATIARRATAVTNRVIAYLDL
jgi:hypothetical protein